MWGIFQLLELLVLILRSGVGLRFWCWALHVIQFISVVCLEICFIDCQPWLLSWMKGNVHPLHFSSFCNETWECQWFDIASGWSLSHLVGNLA